MKASAQAGWRLLVVLFLVLVGIAECYVQTEGGIPPAIIPRPVSMSMGQGSFTLTAGTLI